MKKARHLLLGLTSFVTWAAVPDMSPLVDHLRTLPASVHGEIFLKSSLPVMDNNQARVSIRPDRNISFSFDEEDIYVNMTGALNMCVKTIIDLNDGCLQVDVKDVRWSPDTGFRANLEMASYDVFGLIADSTREELEATLNARFGQKMQEARAQLLRFRQSKNIAESRDIARALGHVFVAPGSVASSGPEFGGRVGITFDETCTPSAARRDHAIQIADLRVGIPCGDDVTLETSFFHNNQGLSITGMGLKSREGININQGTEFAQNQRLIVHNLSLDMHGIDSNVTIGASETVLALAVLLEVISQGSGNPPSQQCHMCELARLTPFTNDADLLLRENVLGLVNEHQAQLVQIGVSMDVISQFLVQENCTINGMKCQRDCQSSFDEREACIERCVQTYRQCSGSGN